MPFFFYRIVCVCLLCVQGAGLCSDLYGQSSGDRYQEALDFRDGKITGYTKDQSQQKAQEIFYECAQKGNAKAMHNYALIKNAQGDYEEACTWFHKASKELKASENNMEKLIKEGKAKRPLYLVVGSDRHKFNPGRLINAITDDTGADLEHIHTFQGLSTTMDLLKCDLNDKNHIVGDARFFDFSNYTLQGVLIERLFTAPENLKSNFEIIQKTSENYLGACIENLSKYMKPGTVMDIEWLPCTTGVYISKQGELEHLTQKNPFQAFVDMNVVFQGVFFLGGETHNILYLPEDFSKKALEMMNKILLMLKFYHSQGVCETFKDLVTIVYWEAKILYKMAQMRADYVCLEDDIVNQDYKTLIKTLQKNAFFNCVDDLNNKPICFKNKKGQDINGVAYTQSAFMSQSLLNFLIQDMSAELNKPYVLQYINTLDFKLISLDKTSNPHTGRKHVWMIRLKKK